MNPDWFSAIGSIVQAVGTVGAFVVGGFLLRREIMRDIKREEASRKEQAVQVYAVNEWLGYAAVPTQVKTGIVWLNQLNPREGVIYVHELEGQEVDGLHRTHLTQIINSSSAPLFDVWVPIADTPSLLGVSLVRPQSMVEFSWSFVSDHYIPDPKGSLVIAFTDASGTPWFRDENGTLTEISPLADVRVWLAAKWGSNSRSVPRYIHMNHNVYNLHLA